MSTAGAWVVDHWGLIVGVAAGVAAFFRWVFPRLRTLGHLIDDFAGEPARPGVPARPGLMERVRRIEESTDPSIRDELANLSSKVDALSARTGSVEDRLEQYRNAAAEASRDKARTWDVIDDAIHAAPPSPPAPA